MFTVNLGTGKTFEATGVMENFRRNAGYGTDGYSLSIDKNGAELTLEQYKEMLDEDGALDTIVVLGDSGAECATYEGYTNITNLNMRLLSNGEKSLSIQLDKGIAEDVNGH